MFGMTIIQLGKFSQYHNFLLFTAGGLGALINGDFLRDKLSSIESLHVVLDGSMLTDQPSHTGEHVMANLYRKTFYFHNLKGL